MPDRIPGASAGSNYSHPPAEGSNQSSGSARPAWLSASSSMPTSAAQPPSRVSSGSAPRAPSPASSSSWWSASPGPSSASSVQQPLLGSQTGGNSGGSWWQRSPPAQASSSATAPSHSSYQPPGSEVSQLHRLAPPARGGSLFQAYADISTATSEAGGSQGSYSRAAMVHKLTDQAVSLALKGYRMPAEDEQSLADQARSFKDMWDHRSSGSNRGPGSGGSAG